MIFTSELQQLLLVLPSLTSGLCLYFMWGTRKDLEAIKIQLGKQQVKIAHLEKAIES